MFDSTDIPGTYTYTINALDVNGNTLSSPDGTFEIVDTDGISISIVDIVPATQVNGGNVNISVLALDDVEVADVWLIIEYPDSTSVNITLGPGIKLFYNNTYSATGVYSVTAWAVDTSGNLANATGNFTIEDTESPVVSNTLAVPTSLENGEDVLISADVVDNVGVVEVIAQVSHMYPTWHPLFLCQIFRR